MRKTVDKAKHHHFISIKDICSQARLIAMVLLAITLGTGCLEEEEGCLDNTASNFNPIADISCEDCCTFPTLQIEIAHRVQDSILLQYGLAYPVDSDSSAFFNISKVKFYLSNFRLENDTKSVGVTDTVTLTYLDGTQETVEDNFLLISRDITSFEYDIGTFKETGSYNRIRFTVGLSLPATQTNPETLTNHPLAIQTDSMYSIPDQSYIFNRITYQRDTSDINSIISVDVQDVAVEVVLDYEEEINLGFDVEIPIKIDYWKWLEGIIFVTDLDEIRANIVTNTAKAFTIDN